MTTSLSSLTVPAGSSFPRRRPRSHRSDPRIWGRDSRARELIAELGYEGGKTILDDHLREVRPRLTPRRTYQPTVYRPGEICQFDPWEPKAEIPVGHGQTRRAWVVTCALGFSCAGAGALIFARQAPDIHVRRSERRKRNQQRGTADCYDFLAISGR
jgi:hypothetical protein